jgi:hypothetical protein
MAVEIAIEEQAAGRCQSGTRKRYALAMGPENLPLLQVECRQPTELAVAVRWHAGTKRMSTPPFAVSAAVPGAYV